MARSISFILFITLIVLAVSSPAARSDDPFALGPEKRSHVHFYFHDTLSGPNPTAVRVAAPSQASNKTIPFGLVVVADDPLTEGPELGSKLIGRGQGMYTFAAQEELALHMSFTFAFTVGPYNGSTLTMVGRNAVPTKVREIPIVGGSGYFRGARGYALAQTNTINFTTGDAIIEFDIYVIHN